MKILCIKILKACNLHIYEVDKYYLSDILNTYFNEWIFKFAFTTLNISED